MQKLKKILKIDDLPRIIVEGKSSLNDFKNLSVAGGEATLGHPGGLYISARA